MSTKFQSNADICDGDMTSLNFDVCDVTTPSIEMTLSPNLASLLLFTEHNFLETYKYTDNSDFAATKYTRSEKCTLV